MSEIKRDIKYLNKDFDKNLQSIINYSKTYFPKTYNDFSISSPGRLFMEMAAYIGDVQSFYLDNQIQETFLQFARETPNLYQLAYMFGYKPRVTYASTVPVTIYQTVPASGSSGEYPDYKYAVQISPNSKISSDNEKQNVNFLIGDNVDFSFSSSQDPTEISVYSLTGGNIPDKYLLTKTRNASSIDITTTSFNFTNPVEFNTVEIEDENIIGILDIIDSDGNTWYEVDYLGQESIYDSISNTNENDPNNSVESNDAPYLLKLKKIQRRFATRVINEKLLQIQFGAGTTSSTTEEIIPNSNNVGLGLPFEIDKLTTAYSPTNFMFDNTYGIAPSNTTLTVRYMTGGGVNSNIIAKSLNQIAAEDISFKSINLNSVLANSTISSIEVTNLSSATGGADGDSVEELRQNSISNISTQMRNVTLDDYIVRTLSLPSKFGTIAKVFIQPSNIQDLYPGEISTLSLYLLSYDVNKNLQSPSDALKSNLRTYLNQHKILGDSLSIKNAFIVNISVEFEIIVLPRFNNNDVILKCINSLKDYFNIDNQQINSPIRVNEIYVMLDRIEGVQTVKNIKIENKKGQVDGYSNYSYDLSAATQNKVIYPSIDPMIFEVRFPENDIKGRVVPL